MTIHNITAVAGHMQDRNPKKEGLSRKGDNQVILLHEIPAAAVVRLELEAIAKRTQKQALKGL